MERAGWTRGRRERRCRRAPTFPSGAYLLHKRGALDLGELDVALKGVIVIRDRGEAIGILTQGCSEVARAARVDRHEQQCWRDGPSSLLMPGVRIPSALTLEGSDRFQDCPIALHDKPAGPQELKVLEEVGDCDHLWCGRTRVVPLQAHGGGLAG